MTSDSTMTSDPDQIRGQITQTQRNLSADVDALTEKLSPPRIAQRRVQRTRAAMTNVKEKIMGSAHSGASSASQTVGSTASSAGETVSSAASSAAGAVSSAASSAADAVSSAPDVARQRTEGNPLAAGLIAFGVGWLASSLLPATPAEQRVAAKVKDTAVEQGKPVAQQAAQAAKEQLAEPARQAAESVKETASGAVSAVKEQASSSAEDVTGRAGKAADTVRQQSRPAGG
jgi:Protein of unknown function (DUF3618)